MVEACKKKAGKSLCRFNLGRDRAGATVEEGCVGKKEIVTEVVGDGGPPLLLERGEVYGGSSGEQKEKVTSVKKMLTSYRGRDRTLWTEKERYHYDHYT